MSITVTPVPKTSIRATSFDPKQTDQSVLCLEVGRDRFQLLVQDNHNRVVCLEDYRFSSLLTERPLLTILPDVFRTNDILSGGGAWREIRISVNSSAFTLIPQALFRKEYAGSYLTLMRGSMLSAHEFAQVYAHGSEGIVSVFNQEHALSDFFSETFPLQSISFVHQTSTLIRATADLHGRSLGNGSVNLYFEDEFVTILCWKERTLRFCNRFGYKNVQDLVYYILYVLDEQNAAADGTALSLFGEITPFSSAYTELKRFSPTLNFGQIPPGLPMESALDDLPAHRYLSLYGLGLLTN